MISCVLGQQVEQRTVQPDGLAADVVDEIVRVFAADVGGRGPSSPPRTSTSPLVMSRLARIRASSTSSPFEHEARLPQRAGHQAERLRQHDPFDFPRAGRALVVGHHGVHQRGGVLAHDRDRRRGCSRRRSGCASAAWCEDEPRPWRERLVHLAHFGLHHQLDVHGRVCRACRRPGRGSSRLRRWCRASCARR